MPSSTPPANPRGSIDVVYQFAFHPEFAEKAICYAARISGLYQSPDGGVTWDLMYESLKPQSPITTPSVCLSPDYASDNCIFAGAIGGILRSYDGGENWEISVLPEPAPTITNLVISPAFKRDGTLLAGTLEDGVYRSSDRGTRWSPLNFGLLNLSILSMAISPGFEEDETVYAGTEIGLYLSTNGGRAWREVPLPIETAVITSIATSPNFMQDKMLFAGTEGGNLYRSEDNGKSWVQLDHPHSGESVNAIQFSPDFPSSPEMMILTSEGILISLNRGMDWQPRFNEVNLEFGISCVGAPLGLEEDSTIYFGMGDGTILRVN